MASKAGGTYGFRGRRIGWGPWRARWYSICSRHGEPDPDCDLCMTGHYTNTTIRWIDAIVHRRACRLWHWWHNRPNSRSRRFLEGVFPKLKSGGE